MPPDRLLLLGASLLLVGCTCLDPELASRPAKVAAMPAIGAETSPVFTLTEMMAFAQASAQLDAKAQAAEMKRLKAGAAASAVDRLKLAYLLSRNSGGGEDLVRAKELLAGLDGAFHQAPLSHYVRELQRLVGLEMALLQERRRGTELQEKIERLKSLELQLQERGTGKTEPGR